MVDDELSGGSKAVPRRRRSAEERRRVVEETLEPGASVARVALKYGVNANQVFQWRRLYRDGKLGAALQSTMKLLPVRVVDENALPEPGPIEAISSNSGAIHIEFGGEVCISLEGGVDPALVRIVLESLRS